MLLFSHALSARLPGPVRGQFGRDDAPRLRADPARRGAQVLLLRGRHRDGEEEVTAIDLWVIVV